MADGVVAVWSRGCVSHAYRVPPDGLVLGRELLPETTDDRISRAHARVDRVGERLVVSDAGSRNGTFVNGQHPESAGNEVVPGAVIRTGRTLWMVVADVDHFDVDRRVQSIADAVSAVASDLEISASFLELCLLQPRTRALLDSVAAAARRRVALGGKLLSDDLEIESDPSSAVHAVFPGHASATNAARRIAAALPGATTRALADSNALVEARRGDRRVAITCPPSTAYLVELYDGTTLVASGQTLKDPEVIAVASGWLDATSLAAVVQASAFLSTK